MSWNPFKRKLRKSTTLVCKFCGSDEYYINSGDYHCGNCHAYCNMGAIGQYKNIPFI